MVVDSSAIIAILLREPEGEAFERLIAAAPRRLMSAVTRVELSIVAEGRRGEVGRVLLERFLEAADIEVVPVSLQHAALAIEGFRRFGKGRHRAALNIGDCFAYALARATGMALLFKGDDFVHTDVRAAASPA